MDPARKNRRIGIVSVVAALVLVCLWWTVAPRTEVYKKHERNAKVKDALRSINPPPKTSVDIDIIPFGEDILVTGTYVSELDCEGLKRYYKEQFPKHGFAYKGDTEGSGIQLSSMVFSGPEYEASLACVGSNTPRHLYTIMLSRKNVVVYKINPPSAFLFGAHR